MSDDKLGLIGKTIAEVATTLNDTGEYSYRITKRDGVPRVCTRDFDLHRVNLELESGRVVNYSFG